MLDLLFHFGTIVISSRPSLRLKYRDKAIGTLVIGTEPLKYKGFVRQPLYVAPIASIQTRLC